MLYLFGLLLLAGMTWTVFRVLGDKGPDAAIERELSAIGLKPRQIYGQSVEAIKDCMPLVNVLSTGKLREAMGNPSEDPLAALFFFANETSPEELGVLTIDWYGRERMKPVSVKQIQLTRLFVASAELSDAEFQKIRLRLSTGQKSEADKIRAIWRNRISDRMRATAKADQDREETRQQKDLWQVEHTNLASGIDLTDWLRAQSSDMWYEICLNVDWLETGAADLVPFIEWLIERPEFDQGAALALLAKAVADGIEDEPYQQFDCARNRIWMKTVHDGLINGSYAAMQWAIPPHVWQDVEMLFLPESNSAWAIAQIGKDQIPTQTHTPEHAFIGNRPVESFAAWKARRWD